MCLARCTFDIRTGSEDCCVTGCIVVVTCACEKVDLLPCRQVDEVCDDGCEVWLTDGKVPDTQIGNVHGIHRCVPASKALSRSLDLQEASSVRRIRLVHSVEARTRCGARGDARG